MIAASQAYAARTPGREGSVRSAGSGTSAPTTDRASETTQRARVFVAARTERATELGRLLADRVGEPEALARALRRGLVELADPEYHATQAFVAPGIGITLGVRSPLLRALGRGFRSATRRDSPVSLLLAADTLLREPELEAHWFAFGILSLTLPRDHERTWQIVRRAGREAGDWITVDTLAHTLAAGILAEPYRWAELEQLVYSPSRWERRLAASTIATIPFANRTAGRTPDTARHGLEVLSLLIGDAEPDVQKAIAWAYRSLALVDAEATTVALETEAENAVGNDDGHRAWVIRDALTKLEPTASTRIRTRLLGIRRRSAAPSTSRAAEIAGRFAGLGLGQPIPEPPLS
ncbi:MAG: DNA alkylation repair protein [Chloroflexota bacterium]